jgi:hypothetical protein
MFPPELNELTLRLYSWETPNASEDLEKLENQRWKGQGNWRVPLLDEQSFPQLVAANE